MLVCFPFLKRIMVDVTIFVNGKFSQWNSKSKHEFMPHAPTDCNPPRCQGDSTTSLFSSTSLPSTSHPEPPWHQGELLGRVHWCVHRPHHQMVQRHLDPSLCTSVHAPVRDAARSHGHHHRRPTWQSTSAPGEACRVSRGAMWV